MRRAVGNGLPQPVRAHRRPQFVERGRIPGEAVEPRLHALYAVDEQDRVHLRRRIQHRPRRQHRAGQEGVEHPEEGRGVDMGHPVEGLGGAAVTDQARHGLVRRWGQRRPGGRSDGRRGCGRRLARRLGDPGDVRPVAVAGAQGVRRAAPLGTRERAEHRLGSRRLSRPDPEDGLRRLALGVGEVGVAIGAGQRGNLRVAPVRGSTARRGRGRSRAGSSGRRASRTSTPRASGCR